MSTLTEALTSAKKEIESQGVRLRDLEAMLNEERRAREEAEERASRLERESQTEREEHEAHQLNGDIRGDGPVDLEVEEKTTGHENGSASPENTDATVRLQQRLELMVTEMTEMKLQMERYRERAETAEADRKTLAEMIESIRRDNARTSSREAKRRSRSGSPLGQEVISSRNDQSEDINDAEEGEITIIKDNDLEDDGTKELLRRAGVPNGHAVEPEKDQSATKASNALATRQMGRADLMYHGGPVGAIVTVVAIGVAVMAMLNQYPKAER
jgi:hypothetical protein